MNLRSEIKFEKLLKNSGIDLATRGDAKHLDSDTKQEILTKTENGSDFKELVLNAIREDNQWNDSYSRHSSFLDDDSVDWGNDDSTSFDWGDDDNSTEDWIDSSNDWNNDDSGWNDDSFDGFGGFSGGGGSDDTW